MEYSYGVPVNAPYYSYVYRITNLYHNKHYYGSRYCKMSSRYSFDPLDDLKQYQTSSSDNNFKEELRLYPERFKFKIVKKFNNSSEAINFESKIHYRLNVAENHKFYNKTNCCFSSMYIYKDVKIFDMENKIILSFLEAIDIWMANKFNIINLYQLLNNKTKVVDNRFCIYFSDSYINNMLQRKEEKEEIRIFYKFNDESKQVEEVHLSYNEGVKISKISSNFTKLWNGIYEVSEELYSSYELCKKYSQILTFYKITNNNTIDEIKVHYKNVFKLLGKSYTRMEKGETSYINGYYEDLEICKLRNSLLILEKEDVLMNIKYTDGNKTLGNNFKVIFSGKKALGFKLKCIIYPCLNKTVYLENIFDIDTYKSTFN